MFPRFAAGRLRTALADSPVVFLMGPRQCGKNTLIKTLIDDTWTYITLGDQTQCEIVRVDPMGFVRTIQAG